MQSNNNWSTASSQDTNYGPGNYTYTNTYVPVTNGNTPSTLMSLSQPNTPRPEPNLPLAQNDNIDNNATHKSRSTERASSFSTNNFQTSPYPTSPIRRRRTESSMFTFETGPTFSSTKQLLEIWNMDQTNSHQLQIHVKMDRGFFRADQDWTCYRRNYFQVNATFDVHGVNYLIQGPEVPCLVQTEQRQLFQVDYFSIGVSACVSGSDKKIDLIQHTPKRDKGPQMIPQPRALRSGGNLHLAPVGSNHNIVTFERMQFKTATANNGKRRAAQQYYEIVVDLYANTSNGHSLRVASCSSAPLVVRGRSPGHYADFHSRYRGMDSDQPTVGIPNHPVSYAPPLPPPPPPNLGSLPSQSTIDDRFQQPPSRYMSLPTSPSHDFGHYQSYPPPPPPPSSFYPPIIPPSGTVPSSSTRSGYQESDYVVPSSAYPQQQQQQQGYYPSSQTTPLTSPTTDDKYTRQTMVYGDRSFKPSSPEIKSNIIQAPTSSSSSASYYTDQYHPPTSSSESSSSSTNTPYSSYTNNSTKISPYASSTLDKSSSVDAGRSTE